MVSQKNDSSADRIMRAGESMAKAGNQLTASTFTSCFSVIVIAVIFMTFTHQCADSSGNTNQTRPNEHTGYVNKETQKILDKATTETMTLFHTAIPEGTLNWDTCETTYLEDKNQVLVEFEYSKINALGVREQYQYWIWWNEDITKIEHEKEKFLYYRE